VELGAGVTQRTYWHLQDRGRVPQPYDIASSQLLYHRELGFEVPTPGGAWLQRHGVESRLRGSFAGFRDPRATTYARYVELQADQESFAEQLLRGAEESRYDAALPVEWLQVLEAVLPVLRFPCHALQMLAAYLAHVAPEGRVVVAAAFQAADELRRVQHLAYRMRQLQQRQPDFGAAARDHWQALPAWQPLRELLERLLVTYDFGEAFTALAFVVKPALDELYLDQFAALALERGDHLLAELARALARDCRWHRDWSDALLRSALTEHPENRQLVREWIAHWWSPTRAALPALVQPWAVEAERARELVSGVEEGCRARWAALGLTE
jgi:toluene monooxygenase system protein E